MTSELIEISRIQCDLCGITVEILHVDEGTPRAPIRPIDFERAASNDVNDDETILDLCENCRAAVASFLQERRAELWEAGNRKPIRRAETLKRKRVADDG